MATGEKGPATTLELGTYALSRSFSYASHRDRSRSFVPHRYIRAMGDEGSQPVSVAHVAETPR